MGRHFPHSPSHYEGDKVRRETARLDIMAGRPEGVKKLQRACCRLFSYAHFFPLQFDFR